MIKLPRPALPGGFVSALAAVTDVVRRAAVALWASFWALWGNVTVYPIVGLIAFGMFALGYGEGKSGAAALRSTIVDLRAEVGRARAEAASLADMAAKARQEAKEAQDELAAIKDAMDSFRPPAAPARAPARRPSPPPAPKPAPDTSWKPF